MDKKYWDTFYKKKHSANFPSPFAIFCLEKYIPKNSTILELGSGNGRDAFYFIENKHRVIAVDQSSIGVNIEKEKLRILKSNGKLTIVQDNFVSMNYSKYKNVDIVYSRFTMHSISLNEEVEVCRKVIDILPKHGLFLVEARTIKDDYYGVGIHKGGHAYLSDHYRRFINANDFIRRSIDLGYEIVYFVEDRGLSKYKNEDPYLMRIVLRK